MYAFLLLLFRKRALFQTNLSNNSLRGIQWKRTTFQCCPTHLCIYQQTIIEDNSFVNSISCIGYIQAQGPSNRILVIVFYSCANFGYCCSVLMSTKSFDNTICRVPPKPKPIKINDHAQRASESKYTRDSEGLSRFEEFTRTARPERPGGHQ